MKSTMLGTALFATLGLGLNDVARAQGPRVSPSAVVPLGRAVVAHGDPRVPPIDLHEVSRYAGWGGTIGAALGAGYALAFERGSDRYVLVIWDGLIGFTGGLTVGAAVYLVKLARESR